MGIKIVLTFSVRIVEGNGQVGCDFLTTSLKGARMFLGIQ
jgi:hypothetical protein